MHTPHGLARLEPEWRSETSGSQHRSRPQNDCPLSRQSHRVPQTWCLFAVDYSHLSNVTARQLTQLLGQASIPFVYSAGHNLEYIWVMTRGPCFFCYLSTYLYISQVHESSGHRVLDILNSANWKEQTKTRPKEGPFMQYSMSFASPITPESLPPPSFVNRRSRRDPSPPKAMPSIRILPHTFISHGLNDLESDWREKIAKLLTRGASLLRERSPSARSTTPTTVPPIIRLPHSLPKRTRPPTLSTSSLGQALYTSSHHVYRCRCLQVRDSIHLTRLSQIVVGPAILVQMKTISHIVPHSLSRSSCCGPHFKWGVESPLTASRRNVPAQATAAPLICSTRSDDSHFRIGQ
jgi:hypothetical protein